MIRKSAAKVAKVINNSALKRKLVFILLAIAIPVVFVSYFLDMMREMIVQRTEQQYAAEDFISLVSQFIASAEDEKSLIQLINKIDFSDYENILDLKITNASGDTLYSYKIAGGSSTNIGNNLDHLQISKSIESHSDVQYSVHLSYEFTYLNLRFWIYLTYAVVVFFMLLFLVLLIANKLMGKYILEPIFNLSNVIDHISTEADYSIKLNYHREDEIGALYDKFNGLVETIKVRQDALHGIVGKLKESEIKFRNMADLSPIAMFEAGADGQISFLNRMGLSSFGYSENDLQNGLNIKQLMRSKKDEELPLLSFVKLDELQVRALHAWGIRKSGKEFHVNVFLNPIYKDNLLVGIRGVIIDITERMVMIDNLRKAKLDAEESDNLKSAFLANMSHEIRTPMNSIIGFADMLTEDNLSHTERREFINYINNSGKVLLNLIDDIIDIAKIEAGQIQIIQSEFCLNSLLDELKAFAVNECKRLEKGALDISLYKAREGEFIIHSDPFRIRQIISNLIVNALKFTDEGYVEIGYLLEKIDGNIIVDIYVKDTGIGIAEEKHGEVFERFIKISNSKQKLYGGTGLGLAISKKLSILLGGDIRLESQEGKGALFTMQLPINITEKESESVSEQIEQRMETNLTGKTILIAEDEETNYKFIKAALRKTGAELIWVQNGQLAVDECISNASISLVLMDMKMPIMNGFEATRQIRSKLPNRMPIIAQTAFAMSGEREKSFEAGCDGYLTKPIKPKELLALIAQKIQ